jgi:hypothetical protein
MRRRAWPGRRCANRAVGADFSPAEGCLLRQNFRKPRYDREETAERALPAATAAPRASLKGTSLAPSIESFSPSSRSATLVSSTFCGPRGRPHSKRELQAGACGEFREHLRVEVHPLLGRRRSTRGEECLPVTARHATPAVALWLVTAFRANMLRPVVRLWVAGRRSGQAVVARGIGLFSTCRPQSTRHRSAASMCRRYGFCGSIRSVVWKYFLA